MIKISELLVRKAGMSRGEFQDYWRRVHGPLVMSIPEIRRHVVKYVQSHTQPDWFPFLAGDGPRYDGVAEVWCESVDDARKMFEEPKFRELVTPDEKEFLDLSGTVILLMMQHEIHQRPGQPIHGGIKLFELPSRRRDMTRSECQRYWRDVHAPLVLGVPEMVKPLRRYVQSHCLQDGTAGLPPMRYDGIAELWFDSIEDLSACFGPRYLEIVNLDELRFVEPARSSALVAREYLIYERD